VIDYIDKFTSSTNKEQTVALTVKYAFFLSLDLCLPTDCRCRGLLLHLITPKDTHTHILYESPGRVISPTQRPLPDNKQNSQETDTHASEGIRARNHSKQTVADPRLRPPRPPGSASNIPGLWGGPIGHYHVLLHGLTLVPSHEKIRTIMDREELGREGLCSEADSQHTSGDKEITLSKNQCPGKVFRTSTFYWLGRWPYILLYEDLNTENWCRYVRGRFIIPSQLV
jgi:hypothetical protein